MEKNETLTSNIEAEIGLKFASVSYVYGQSKSNEGMGYLLDWGVW